MQKIKTDFSCIFGFFVVILQAKFAEGERMSRKTKKRAETLFL